MNLHEYQGKEILNSFGVRIQRGIVAQNAQEAVAAAKQLTSETGTSWYVIKAQVHAGGRGKGGGVKLAKNLKEVEEIAGQIIGMDLVTPQTSAEGKRVHQVLVAEDVYYPGETETSEFYVSVILNRGTGRNMIMYSTEGGMDIETVAEETPHLIFTEEVDPTVGLMPTIPLLLAGHTIDPLVSVPIANTLRLDATATADPELDPQGLRLRSYGFLV